MRIGLTINGVKRSLDIEPNAPLLDVLRREGLQSVKHGCETGECGVCAVQVGGVPRNTCVMLAAQADGAKITTVEGIGNPRQMHPIQQTMADNGSIQCGFCIPAMVITAQALLKDIPNPTDEQIRDAISGNLCRCTGYVKPVQAIQRAAAILRGEAPAPAFGDSEVWTPGRSKEHSDEEGQANQGGAGGRAQPGMPDDAGDGTETSVSTLTKTSLKTVGKPERKVDAIKLATGKPCFVDDIELRGLLYAGLLTSPHAHARIRNIDASKARALPGNPGRSLARTIKSAWITSCASWVIAWRWSPPKRRSLLSARLI